jgi:hypothetical protein
VAGADPTDRDTFDPRDLPKLRAAVAELSWLLERGYADGAAATLVGDHHQLDRRQRLAVRRCACTDPQRVERAARRVDLDGRPVAVDALNQLVTIERTLAGGAAVRGRDGVLRDVAGVHGTWRRSERTADALDRLIAALGSAPARFVIDAPVSNSGRLAAAIRERGPEVELADPADGRLLELAREGWALATADGGLLDRCGAWCALAERALPPEAWVVDLGG